MHKANRFQIVDEQADACSFATIDGLGDKAAEMIEDEASKGKFLSREDFKNRCKVSANTVESMAKSLARWGDLPHTNQDLFTRFLWKCNCSFGQSDTSLMAVEMKIQLPF